MITESTAELRILRSEMTIDDRAPAFANDLRNCAKPILRSYCFDLAVSTAFVQTIFHGGKGIEPCT